MIDNLFKEKVVAILHLIIANSNVYSRELANALNDLYKLLEDDNNDR